MIRLSEKETTLVVVVLNAIDAELRRVYWNANQKEINSPFSNTGETYKNDTFSVRAYDWNEDNAEEPNFEYKDLKVYWYKHLGRGDFAKKAEPLTLTFLSDMLDDCLKSLQESNLYDEDE